MRALVGILALSAVLRLLSVAGGRAAIIALHDLTIAARHCHRIVVLERGRVRADAPPAEALGEALLADVFGVRAHVDREAGGAIRHILALDTLDARQPAGEGRL